MELKDYIYYKTDNGTLYNGNVMEVLRLIPDESVDCVVNSPPYFSLRDYDLESVIWGGDKDCKHDWNEIVKKPAGGKGSKIANVGANKIDFANMRDHNVISNVCNKCHAWRGQLGLEPTFYLYIKHLIDIFTEVKRILKKTGTCWVNIGDTYSTISGTMGMDKWLQPKLSKEANESMPKKIKTGLPDKCLCQIPNRFAIAMTDNGWILRNEIIWYRPNQMPQSCKDKFTVDFEKIFFFVKNKDYNFEQQFEPYVAPLGNPRKFGKAGNDDRNDTGRLYIPKENKGRNKRTVWQINTKPLREAHYAVYPEELIITPIKAGCPVDGVVLDPFIGAGTTGLVAEKLNRKWIGIELSTEYCDIAKKRIEIEARQGNLFK